MNKDIKKLMESLFDDETNKLLNNDETDTSLSEMILNSKKGRDGIIYNAIDLDLPSGTLWLDKNIGATKETKSGGYFSSGSNFYIKKISNDKTLGINYDSYMDILYSSKERLSCKSVPEYIIGAGYSTPSPDDVKELFKYTKVILNNKFIKFCSLKNPEKYIIIPKSGRYNSGHIEEKDTVLVWANKVVKGHYEAKYDCECMSVNDNHMYLDRFDFNSYLPIRGIKK